MKLVTCNEQLVKMSTRQRRQYYKGCIQLLEDLANGTTDYDAHISVPDDIHPKMDLDLDLIDLIDKQTFKYKGNVFDRKLYLYYDKPYYRFGISKRH